jgi:hypothetical protein
MKGLGGLKAVRIANSAHFNRLHASYYFRFSHEVNAKLGDTPNNSHSHTHNNHPAGFIAMNPTSQLQPQRRNPARTCSNEKRRIFRPA